MALPAFLRDLKTTESTLPDTNTRQWAATAQYHARARGFDAEIWLIGDVWMISAPGLEGHTFLNVPILHD